MRYHFKPTRKARKWRKMVSVGESVEKLEPSYTVGRTVKWGSHFGKQSDSTTTG